MSKNNVIGLEGREASADPLTELLRSSAGQRIHQAVVDDRSDLLAMRANAFRMVERELWAMAIEIQTRLGLVTVEERRTGELGTAPEVWVARGAETF